MTRDEQQALRELIDLRIELLQALIEENIQSASQPSDTEAGEATASTADTNSSETGTEATPSIEEKAIASAQHELLELTKTLVWLDTEQAGQCQQCGGPIAFDKLKSAPTNRHCEHCIEQKVNDEST